MIAFFLGGAHGKGRQFKIQTTNKDQSSVRFAHTKPKNKQNVWARPHSYFDIIEAAFDFCFWAPLFHHRVAQTGQG
jgi:hypothetical protein